MRIYKPSKATLSVRLPSDLAKAITAEAARFDHNPSWLLQRLVEKALGPNNENLRSLVQEIVGCARCEGSKS